MERQRNNTAGRTLIPHYMLCNANDHTSRNYAGRQPSTSEALRQAFTEDTSQGQAASVSIMALWARLLTRSAVKSCLSVRGAGWTIERSHPSSLLTPPTHQQMHYYAKGNSGRTTECVQAHSLNAKPSRSQPLSQGPVFPEQAES